MKSAVFLLALALPVVAQNSGPSANGDFQFNAGGFAKSIQFNARIDKDGQTKGSMTFVGAAEIPDQDVDGTGTAGPGGLVSNLSMTVEFDCLTISGNRAVMSGEVTESSVSSFVGVRAILAVEDGGEGVKKPIDRFTWGLYHARESGWVPSDADLTVDPGVGLTWLATDFERDDDVGVPSHPSTDISCASFSLAAYALEDVAHGAGNIQVKP